MIFPAIVRSAMMYLRSGVITNRLQSPGTRMMKTARAQPPGNVFQPPDRSVIPWWSRQTYETQCTTEYVEECSSGYSH